MPQAEVKGVAAMGRSVSSCTRIGLACMSTAGPLHPACSALCKYVNRRARGFCAKRLERRFQTPILVVETELLHREIKSNSILTLGLPV